MNKFGTSSVGHLIDELRFQARRHEAHDEKPLADTLRDAADSLEAAHHYWAAVEGALT